jgi:cyclopropane fatty-acyl-phospholipid synthase-like methyltransferase
MRFDRIVSVEMMVHVRNYHYLFQSSIGDLV